MIESLKYFLFHCFCTFLTSCSLYLGKWSMFFSWIIQGERDPLYNIAWTWFWKKEIPSESEGWGSSAKQEHPQAVTQVIGLIYFCLQSKLDTIGQRNALNLLILLIPHKCIKHIKNILSRKSICLLTLILIIGFLVHALQHKVCHRSDNH